MFGELASDDVMRRARVADADLVVIHRGHDSQAVVSAIAVKAVNDRAHIVVHIRSPESEQHLLRVSPTIETVTPMATRMIVPIETCQLITPFVMSTADRIPQGGLVQGTSSGELSKVRRMPYGVPVCHAKS